MDVHDNSDLKLALAGAFIRGFCAYTISIIIFFISGPHISHKASNIPPMLKQLASLRFFATASFQSIAGDLVCQCTIK